MSEQWLTTKEAAAFLGVALPTVQKWIQNGQIRAKRLGKKWLLSRTSLSGQLERFGVTAVSGFLTVEEAAERFQVSKLSLLTAIKNGGLPCQTLSDGRYWRRYLDPAEVAAWKQARADKPRKIRPLASSLPATGPTHYSLAEASKLVHRSVTCLRQAIREGLLKTEDPSRISRTDLEDWLQRLQFLAGQSHRQDLLSLKAAAQQAKVSLDTLRRALLRGQLATESNPAGQPLVAPEELQRWVSARGFADPSRLGAGRTYRLKEIAELTQIKLATVQSDVTKGLLKASLMAGAPPYHLVSEADFVAWLKSRDQKYTRPKLEGEVLSTRQACERFGTTQDILRQGRKTGRLQVARRFSSNGVGLFYSSQEVEQYLKHRSQADGWTRTRIAEFFGINAEAVREAMLRGDLPFEMTDLPGKGPRRCVSPGDLIEWVRRQAPPYRLEMTHLGHFVSYKTAAQLANQPQSAIHAALCSGELSGLHSGAEDAGYHIPRYQFDLWLARQGLPPSWELETDTRWLRIQDAAQLAQVAIPTIQKWLTVGYLVGKRRGRRWLVDRERLLEVADLYRANRENPKGERLTVARVVTLTGLSRLTIEQAIERQDLYASALRQPGVSPLWVVDAQSLIRWLETQAPPYRKEVAQLPPLLSSKVAGKLSGLGQTSVVKALAGRRVLRPFRGGEDGAPPLHSPTPIRQVAQRPWSAALLGAGMNYTNPFHELLQQMSDASEAVKAAEKLLR